MMTRDREDGHLNGYVWMVCAVIPHFHEFMEKKTRIQDLVKVPILVPLFLLFENWKYHFLHFLKNAKTPLSTAQTL